MNTTKEYLDAMNELDKQMEPENREYFSNLRAYMALASFIKDERTINEQLYQMYLDFLQAKDEGFTAEEFFGNNPKEMADQLLEQLPKSSIKTIFEYVGIVAVILWSIRLIFDFSTSLEVIVNPALYLFDLVLVFSFIALLFKFIQRTVYRKPTNRTGKILEGIIALLIFVAFLVLYLRSYQFVPEVFSFAILFPWDMVIIIGLGLIGITWILSRPNGSCYL